MALLKEVYGESGGAGTIRQRLEYFRAKGAQAEAEALREGKGVAARISLLAKGVRVGRGGGHGPQSAR